MRNIVFCLIIVIFSSCEKENIIDQLVGSYTVSGYQLSCSFKHCGDTIRVVDNIEIVFYKSFIKGHYSDTDISLELSYNDDFYLSSNYLFKSINNKKYLFEFIIDGAFSKAFFVDNTVEITHLLNGSSMLSDSSVYTYLKGYKN